MLKSHPGLLDFFSDNLPQKVATVKALFLSEVVDYFNDFAFFLKANYHN
jgi:hypothetical protein